MKKVCLYLMTVICLAGVLLPGQAAAYTDAEARIWLITQHQAKFRSLPVPGTEYTVYQAGCGLFSIAHAMQWLSGVKITEEEETDLIKKLVGLRLNTVSDMTASLYRLMNYDEGLVFHQDALPAYTVRNNSIPQNEELFRSVFDSGGVVIALPKGHYVLAVGYRYAGGQLYIQIVDSAGSATIEPRSGSDVHIGYSFDSMEEITSGNEGAMQYWLPAKCFFGQCAHDRMFKSWWWISGTSALMEEYADPVLPDSPAGGPDFTLPEGVRIIEEEAFAGIPAQRVELPESVRAIGGRAFADCKALAWIRIPGDCEDIAPDAFSGCEGLTVCGRPGSYAETYAAEHGFAFIAETPSS